MSEIKTILRDWIPPAILRVALNFRAKGISFEGNFSTWEEAAILCTGYDDDVILNKVLDATLKVKKGDAAFERDSVLFSEIHYSWPVTAALMWSAAKNNGELHVLDFGGALGSSYFQNRHFLSGLKNVSWSVVEQSNFVRAGQKYVQDDTIRFFPSIEDSLNFRRPNVILFSSVLQYLPELVSIIEKVNSINASVLIFDRTPFTSKINDAICIQKVSPEIYKASYPIRVLSMKKLLTALNRWKLTETFLSPEGKMRVNLGLSMEFLGLIFERSDDK